MATMGWKVPENKTPLIMKKKILFLILFVYCVSCANPTIVNVIGPNDNSLSCEELSNEIKLANKYADEAKEAKKMNIGAAAKKSGLSVKTVRFYSDIGLISPDKSTESNYRIYSNQDVEKLLFVGK